MTLEKTPTGTSVGVEEPYRYVDRCDHVTDDGRCRLAIERPERDPAFTAERRSEGYRCPVVADADPDRPETATLPWADCRHFGRRRRAGTCFRCGLEERRMAHDEQRPLLEEHHLSYRHSDRTVSHEITIPLCRWCHAQVHRSWARLDDDVSPTPAALAAAEGRRSDELDEAAFSTAAERFGEPGQWDGE